MLVKRGVNFTGLTNTIVPLNFKSRGWIKVFVAHVPANVDIVKEFYTHIRNTTEDRGHFQTYV